MKLKKNRKNLKNKVVTGFMVGAMMAMAVTPVFANNYHDSDFAFNFGNGYWQTTPERVKEDDSYVYMNCTSSNTPGDSYDAYVWGWDTDDNRDFETGGPYTYYEGTIRKMTNYVYENDGDYAYIKARHSGAGDGVFSGLWSPDSI